MHRKLVPKQKKETSFLTVIHSKFTVHFNLSIIFVTRWMIESTLPAPFTPYTLLDGCFVAVCGRFTKSSTKFLLGLDGFEHALAMTLEVYF